MKSDAHLFKSMRLDFILCGQTSFFEARPYSVKPTSICEATTHSVKRDLHSVSPDFILP